MTLLLTVVLMAGIDLSNVRLPTLEAIRAEKARRNPVWKPQHSDARATGTPCPYFEKGAPSPEAWRENPCSCPQAMAFYSLADVTGFGGSAGGGKSSLAIGLAITSHRNSAIFRKEKDDSHDLFDETVGFVRETAARTNENLKLVRDIPGNRQVRFFGVKNPGDEQKFRGRPRDFYAFDEATEFDEKTIRFIIGWNRSTIPGQRCRVVLTFNPPSLKHGQWLKQFFAPWIDPQYNGKRAENGELRWFTTINGQDQECGPEPIEVPNPNGGVETIRPVSRTFIRATLKDNAFLRDTDYMSKLLALPEPLRSQLAFGDMNAEESDDAYQLIPTRWIQLAQTRWLKRGGRPDGPLSALGSDPAHGGKDDNAAAARIGAWFDYPKTRAGKLTPDGRDTLIFLAEVAGEYRVVHSVPVGMDVIGVGASPRDLAKEQSMQLVPMNGAERSDPDSTDRSGMLQFANNRAMWWWRFREALDPEKGEDLELPPDPELLVDLTAAHYNLTTRGIVVEDKDDIRKKIGRSPGKGDAVVYCYNVRPISFTYETIAPRRSAAFISDSRPSDSWKKRGF